MKENLFDYALDPGGPRGVSRGSWLERDRLGLIVIDVQNYITLPQFSGAWTADGGDDYYYTRLHQTVLPNILTLIALFRKLGRPVVYTRIASTNHNLRDVAGLQRKLLAQETRDVNGKSYHLFLDEFASEIDERIAPQADDIVVLKTCSGAFASSDIDSVLRNNGISRLVFTGGLTDACVASSVRGAYDRGYLSTIAEDACLTSTHEDHEAALRSLRKFFGWVTSTAEVVAFLQGARGGSAVLRQESPA
jgi:nicotinamidase-related amidase